MDIPLGGRPKPSRAPWFIAAFMLAVTVVFVSAGLRTGGTPTISITTNKPAVGRDTEVDVVFREPKRGLVEVRAALVQGDLRVPLIEETYVPLSAWFPSGDKTEASTFKFRIGKDHQKGLTEGPATIELSAAGASTWMFAGQLVEERKVLPVRLTPPALAVTAREIYVTQGGAEVVTYTVGPTAVKDGVQAGKWFFTGYPRPGGEPNERLALFAVPYDMGSDDKIKLIAEDDVGNRSEERFIDHFRPKPFERDTIDVSDRFIGIVVPRIRSRTPDLPDKGSLLDNYIAINRDLRKANNTRLEKLAAKTQPKFLWSKPFMQMPAKVVSSFADRRTYKYKGKKIDQQDHLGFDLASVKHAEIPAANDGIVVMAEYLGIYGNTVVIDHGLGLMSLYAHCSSMEVKVGDRVSRGQVVGNTGSTGLALGDHLHFTMLLAGLPVTPLEWWDGHWIKDRLMRKLPGVLALAED